ncbi:hypothetical protein BH23CHL8_BH23CHL8_26290 [soil metagenome]
MSPSAPGWSVASPVLPTCVLCGHQGPDVRHGLIRWRDGDPFGSGPRCHDHGACHERVLANGDQWPIEYGRVKGPGRREDIPETIPGPQPEPVEELDFGTAPEATEAVGG